MSTLIVNYGTACFSNISQPLGVSGQLFCCFGKRSKRKGYNAFLFIETRQGGRERGKQVVLHASAKPPSGLLCSVPKCGPPPPLTFVYFIVFRSGTKLPEKLKTTKVAVTLNRWLCPFLPFKSLILTAAYWPPARTASPCLTRKLYSIWCSFAIGWLPARGRFMRDDVRHLAINSSSVFWSFYFFPSTLSDPPWTSDSSRKDKVDVYTLWPCPRGLIRSAGPCPHRARDFGSTPGVRRPLNSVAVVAVLGRKSQMKKKEKKRRRKKKNLSFPLSSAPHQKEWCVPDERQGAHSVFELCRDHWFFSFALKLPQEPRLNIRRSSQHQSGKRNTIAVGLVIYFRLSFTRKTCVIWRFLILLLFSSGRHLLLPRDAWSHITSSGCCGRVLRRVRFRNDPIGLALVVFCQSHRFGGHRALQQRRKPTGRHTATSRGPRKKLAETKTKKKFLVVWEREEK